MFGIGLFISTIAITQQQALMASFLLYMPAILLSGFMFPIEIMPALFQYQSYANPLRYFLVIIRGIFLKGNGVAILRPQMGALFILGSVVIPECTQVQEENELISAVLLHSSIICAIFNQLSINRPFFEDSHSAT